MSELRDELEQQLASVEKQSETQQVNGAEEQIQPTPAEVDEYLDAPAAYAKEWKEKFKELPLDARKQIINREKQVEKGFSDLGNKLNGYKFIDDAFNSRAERLKKMGITTPKQYANFLALLDDGLFYNPAEIQKEIGQIYGWENNVAPQNGNADELTYRVNAQERQLQRLNQMFQESLMQREVASFLSAKDAAGNPKYPYYNEVRERMGVLMDSGACRTLEEAYNQCVWSDENVRKKLIEAQTKADLDAKAQAAEKAKQAGFTPQSKAVAPERELTLREELAKTYDELGIE